MTFEIVNGIPDLSSMMLTNGLGIGGKYLSNWNTETFDNIYADLAQGAYNSRPNSFPELVETDSATEVKFSQPAEDNKGQITQGGSNLPNDGIVYLQPDKSLKSIDENVKVRVPDVNGGYHTEHCVTNSYQKGY